MKLYRSLAFTIFFLAVLIAGALMQRRHTPTPNPSHPISTNGQLVVSIINVGQGDAMLTEFPDGSTMLVDAGDEEHGADVVRYLQARQVKQIDLLVASHPHEDHIGGMADVFAVFPVRQVWDSGYAHGSDTQRAFLQTIKRRGIRYGTPRHGFTRTMGGATIEVLAPARLIQDTESDANNNSLVLLLTYGRTSFLLTGDMEGEERGTVDAWPQATVLKVAHHGSHNGTDAAFLHQVHPQFAAISCAKENPFGHPHQVTLNSLREAGVKAFLTPSDGTIRFSTDGQTLRWTGARVPQANAPAYTPAGQNPSPPPSSTPRYIGNRHSHIFHLPTCSSLPSEENRVYFRMRDEAVRQGYHPCGRCNP